MSDGLLNVRWFGARGNDVADDTDSLQLALDVAQLAAATSSQGTVVYLPRGCYRVSRNIGVESRTTSSGMTMPTPVGISIVGDGHEASIVQASYPDLIEADRRPVAGTGLRRGMISVVGTSSEPARGCSIERIGLIGPVNRVAFPTDFANSLLLSQKGVSFCGTQDCTVRSVRTEGFRDEAIYAEVSDGWRVENCIVRRCLSNAINLNGAWYPADGERTSRDCFIRGNAIDECAASAFQVTGDSFVVTGNTARGWPGYPIGASPVVIDCAFKGIFSDNVITDYDTSAAGVGCVDVFGSVAPHQAVIKITNNIFQNVKSDWDEPIQGGGIQFLVTADTLPFAGTALIEGNTFHDCGRDSPATGGRFIGVFVAAATARIVVAGNVFRNTVGKNLTDGVFVATGVPSGVVQVAQNVYEGVTMPVNSRSANQTLRFEGQRRVVTTLGSTSLALHDELVIVYVNGLVSLILPPASAFVSGRRQLIVRNSSLQAGRTILMPVVAESVEGGNTVVGRGRCKVLEAVDLGTGLFAWFVVSKIT
ncbi:MAG: glycosyl hydrolase family 28-related protein [Leptolyngbyaceae cyanobacterium]